MTQTEVFEKVLQSLQTAEISYMITGSIASIQYGKPRVTYDLDIVAHFSMDKAKKFIQLLGQEFYADLIDIQEFIANKHHFNIIHSLSGLKIDFWPIKDEYDRLRLLRRREEKIGKISAYFSSPEDIILKKLEWVKQGASSRHLDDIKGILSIQGDKIDRDYIITWAERITVKELLKEIGI